jgi:hypothetical protein
LEMMAEINIQLRWSVRWMLKKNRYYLVSRFARQEPRILFMQATT